MMALPLRASNEKLARLPLKMRIQGGWKTVLALVATILIMRPAAAVAQEEGFGNREHEREELGVNRFTTPSIAEIFIRLDQLKPLPFEQLKRDLPTKVSATREQKGLIFGGLIADGFLIVEAERKQLVEEFGRVLLFEARGLGVGEVVTRHSASLTEKGRRGNWEAVRNELIATQTDVEQAMIDLRDERMAHFISLGGWLRAVEMSATAVGNNFSAERAQILAQPELTSYFVEELSMLPPDLIHAAMFEKIRNSVKAIDSILNRKTPGAPTVEDVRQVQRQAQTANDAIRGVD